MTKSHRPAAEDVDLPTLGRALWQAKGWIFGLTIGAGLITFVVLSMVRPLFTSEARILIQNDESAFTRPTADEGRDPRLVQLDEQAVQSQVQVLTSRDLAVDVVKSLDLTNNADFAKDEGLGLLRRILNSIGLRASPKSEEEKAANTFADNLDVFQLAKSSVISIEYTSGDSPLAAKIANQLADSYIEWQRNAKLEQTKDATAWLRDQIEVLRKKTAEAEAAAEQFRSSEGLYSGGNNITLNAQQLSEINSQLILAKAQRSEAEARARLIQKMIDDGGDIDATPEVLKSELVGRLIEQRVQVQRELAQLSATLLPSHPRIKQLNSELADVREQIRDEAAKIVKGLKNEAEVASARETSLRNSLNDTKAQASGQGDAEIKLRALEREAKANRDLLESFLARYRDASARHDMGSVPAQAAIVSRAHASILPSFPKRGPLSLLIMAATALLALAYVVARELIGAPEEGRDFRRAREPESPVKARKVPVAPPAAAQMKMPPRPQMPPAPPAHPNPEPAVAAAFQPPKPPLVIAPPKAPAASAPSQAATAAAVMPAMAGAAIVAEAKPAKAPSPPLSPKPETVIALGPPPEAPKPKVAEAQPQPKIAEPLAQPKIAQSPAKPMVVEAQPTPMVAETKPKPMVAESQSKPIVAEASSKPSFAAAVEPALAAAAIAGAAQAASSSAEAKDTAPKQAQPRAASMSASDSAKVETKPASSGPANPPASEQSSASGLLDRLRQGLAAAQSEPKPEATAPSPGLLARLRRALPGGEEASEQAETAKPAPASGETIPPLRPNDLRHYLNQRIAQATRSRVEEPKVTLPAPKVGNGKVGPVLKSLDGVLNHIFSAAKDGAPRAVLVSGATPQVDATQEAIRIARALVARREAVVLIDLTRGASAVSGPLGLPRAPGFTDLAAGRAGFDDVIRVDTDTSLQVIAAGNPAVKPKGEEVDRFMRVFEALTEAYDCVVLHADRDTVKKLTPALKFELPVTVVVLPQGASANAESEDLGDFAALGCPVVVYEQTGKEGRSGLLGRVAAI